MKYVYGDFSNYHTKPTGWWGMELEVEALKVLPIIEGSGWTTKADDSLRHVGREYVTTRPMPDKEEKLRQIIDGLVDTLKKHSEGLLYDSPRTSFHVHMNTYKMTPIQVINTAVLYWLIEPVITDFCGPKRKGNLFCLRLQDAEDALMLLQQEVRRANVILTPGNNNYKYAGLNLCSMNRLGTMEFRCMRGAIDTNVLFPWVNTLGRIRDAAMEYGNPQDICNMFYKSNKKTLVSRLTHEAVASHVLASKSFDQDIRHNEVILNNFAHSVVWKVKSGEFTSNIEKVYLPSFRKVRVDQGLDGPAPAPRPRNALRIDPFDVLNVQGLQQAADAPRRNE